MDCSPLARIARSSIGLASAAALYQSNDDAGEFHDHLPIGAEGPSGTGTATTSSSSMPLKSVGLQV